MSDIKLSPAPTEQQTYLIDTDVLATINNRRDGSSIYRGLIAMAHRLQLRTVRQVFSELKRFPKPFEVLRGHEGVFVIPLKRQYDTRVSGFVEILTDKMPTLYEQTGSNPDPADPWLVAVAATYRYTVVTNERPLSANRIPAACRLPRINCRCISGPHFLIETRLVTEIDPAHIDPTAFFRKE